MIMWKYGAQSPRLFSSKSRKGKAKQKANGPKPYASTNPDPSPFPPAPPRNNYPPPQGPPPRYIFPKYTPGSSTPLPPPSMPRKWILRRLAPLVLPLVLAGYGAYRCMKHSNEQPSENIEEAKVEVFSSAPTGSFRATLAEKTAQ